MIIYISCFGRRRFLVVVVVVLRIAAILSTPMPTTTTTTFIRPFSFTYMYLYVLTRLASIKPERDGMSFFPSEEFHPCSSRISFACQFIPLSWTQISARSPAILDFTFLIWQSSQLGNVALSFARLFDSFFAHFCVFCVYVCCTMCFCLFSFCCFFFPICSVWRWLWWWVVVIGWSW